MTSPVSPSFQSMQHDKTYYIHGGDLVVLVENLLFRVHRYFFERESVFFRSLFETPRKVNEPEPGSSDSTAIMLDTTASQFSRFLWVFYNPKLSLYDEATLEDWKSILELSHRWLFPEVKQLAIRELQKQPLSPVQRIELYHKNSVDRNFLIGDYIALCQRPQPLNLNEGLDLGLETTLMIARTREEIRTPRSPEGVMTPLTPTLQGPELIGLIGKMFVASEGLSDDGNGLTVNTNTSMGQQSATRPVITINGISPEPPKVLGETKTPKTATQGGNGSISGGSQANKTDKRNQKSKPKNQSTGKKEEKGEQQKGQKATTASQTAETGAGGEEGDKNKGDPTPTPVAGQQEAKGDTNGDNQENDKDESKSKGGEAREGVKPGATVGGTEAGPKAEGAVDAQGASVGDTAGELNGQMENTNGGVDKNKATDPTTNTTGKPTGTGDDNSSQQQGTTANGVGTNGD